MTDDFDLPSLGSDEQAKQGFINNPPSFGGDP